MTARFNNLRRVHHVPTTGEVVGMSIGTIALILFAALAVTFIAPYAGAQEHSNPWLKEWIEPACCVTNDCCWEIQAKEVRPLPGDQWQIVATGQIVKRKDYSPDGKYYRCACDFETGKGWVRHDRANTRCLFVPMQSAMR